MPQNSSNQRDDQRGGAEGRGDEDLHGGEGLIPTRRQSRQLRLHEVELVHDHGEVIARLDGG
jgi:hypothetical protein